MKEVLLKVYALLFARPVFMKWNNFLYHAGLRGLGVLNYKSAYYSGESDWLKKYLKNKRSPVIFDVGANVGDYTQSVLNASPEAKIYAFEPHPVTFENLKCRVNVGNVSIYNVGVGDKKEELVLYDYLNKDGSSHASLFEGVITDIHSCEAIGHEVNVISLDDFVEENDVQYIDLLKIDTEGNEYSVLLGVEKMIAQKRIGAIHFEFNEMNIISKSTFKNFWDLLKGYSFYRLLPGGHLLPLRSYGPVECEIYAYQNIIAIRLLTEN